MKWHTRLIASIYDVFLMAFIAWSLLWLILLTTIVPHGPHAWLLLLAPAIFFIFLASLLIHELGHLIAALIFGFEISSFATWPLQWTRTREGSTLRYFHWQFSRLGQVTAYPRTARNLLLKRAFFVYAGLLVSLFIATGSLTLTYALNDSAYSIDFWKRLLVPRSGAAFVFFVISLVNFYLFFANFRPTPFKNFYPDGAALLAMFWNRSLIVHSWLVETLSWASRNSVRPRELNYEMIDHLLAAQTGSAVDVDADFIAFYYRLDAGHTERAGELIDLIAENWENYDLYHQLYAVLEKAYFEARHRHNALEARRWFDQTPLGTIEQQTHLRAEAAVLLVEERYKEAAEKATAALEVLPQSADPGGAIAEKEWLESILAESSRKVGEEPRTQ